MKSIVLAAICGVLVVPGLAAAQLLHVHTAACNHQWVDDQGAFATSPSFTTLSVPISQTATTPSGMIFELNDLGGVGEGTLARAGFEAAAALWSNVLLDPITIRLDVQFSALGAGILGSTGSTTNTMGYSTLRGLMVGDAKSSFDTSAVNSLQTGPLTFVSNEPPISGAIDSRTRFLDNNNSFDNNNINVNTAQIKALGATPTYAANNPNGRDGLVSFSTAFNWDFDRSDGITDGFFDFVGVAAHEIGHALGFRSGVDTADINALPGVGLPGRRGLNNLAWGTVMDLFRYGEFEGDAELDWSIAGSPCMSIDAGVSCVAAMSTGRLNGDLRQASHWKDDVLLNTPTPLGIMDPTATGINGSRPFMALTAADLIAFDVIGYDVAEGHAVPEPGSWALVVMGLGVAGAVTRRRRQAAQATAT